MRYSPAWLLALALLLDACAAPTAAADTNDSYCALLAQKNVRTAAFGRRRVSVAGRAVGVALLWGSEPARAAAALLAALLRRVRRYDGVLLQRAPHDAAELAERFRPHPTAKYDNLVIAVSTAWQPDPLRSWDPSQGYYSGLAGARLVEFGASAVPARCRLFARLAQHARQPSCQQRMRWAFYGNQTAFADCGFVGATIPPGNESAVEVLGVGDCGSMLRLLLARSAAAGPPLRPRRVHRTEFVRTLQAANHSFLFLDYDMWEGDPGVGVVEPAPCAPAAAAPFDCKQELDSAIAMRVADVDSLRASASQLFQFVHDFKPSPESLRWILERQASGVDIEEAGCEWALRNNSYDVSKADVRKYDLSTYKVPIYVCSGDPSDELFRKISELFEELINRETYNAGFVIEHSARHINCADKYDFSKKLDEFTRTVGIHSLLGAVSVAAQGAALAVSGAAANGVPLLLAAVVPEAGTDARSTWRVAGRPPHIAHALHHFVRASGWTRVAVLSQPTELATDCYAALKDKAGIILRNFPIENGVSHLTEQQAQEVLQQLQSSNARIVFVNADAQAAHTVLTAAAARGMAYSDGFVWIVHEWPQSQPTCATEHFTVSFWDQGLEDNLTADGWEGSQALRELMSGQKAEHTWPWPPRAVSLANALLTISMGFKDVVQRFPNTRQDLHSDLMIRSLQESLIGTPVAGVAQRLHYRERSLEEALVFLQRWGGGRRRRLAAWRVNATSGAVRGHYARPADLPRHDGASACIVRSGGDEFDPACYDAPCACALLLLALAPGAALLLRRRLQRLRRQQQIQLIARRRHVATVLSAYLVERAALELHEELGAGRFGSVRLARLRAPGRAPRYVAAKALRDNAAPAEESEFLREACTIASLEHAHVVRLVGVCIADGPPLVLMELAFFGDLLGYLRARRHLVEGAGSEAAADSGEAQHVSGAALTRLARQAAQALQYLAARGVVHRDVRAANCLLDVRRALKLADFGMARDTVAGADGAPEYSCRRRGLFPVLWMAPESLAHGVFSAASDVWALGVLVLELVTLGARPYGAMSPLRVLEYVAAGGAPPLPLDATPQTRGLARLCWARAAERRPSAAEVAAYLAARPLALHPALLSERDVPADADSGFGESPSTELLPPDSPVHSLDQFEDLAASH